LVETRGELKRGLELGRKALELRSDSPPALLAVSMSYWHQRRYNESIEWANALLLIAPTSSRF
jgi:hypothetical protein